MMWWDGNDSWSHIGYGGGWVMFFGMILVTVALVLLVVFLVRQTTNAGGSAGMPQALPSAPAGPAPETPRDILKRRYAAGEVDRDEYLQKLSDL
ncbi:MAG: SHOCT domain-containing protein [Thermoleophilia bacterium]